MKKFKNEKWPKAGYLPYSREFATFSCVVDIVAPTVRISYVDRLYKKFSDLVRTFVVLELTLNFIFLFRNFSSRQHLQVHRYKEPEFAKANSGIYIVALYKE